MRLKRLLSSNKLTRRGLFWRVLGAIVLVIAFVLIILIITFSRRDLYTYVMFQNADELRATGGFFGSLAQIRTRGFRVVDFRLRDIYDLDAQIPAFPPAPVGVQKYLSGGKNTLHLQDSNWERDFPTSAKLISQQIVAARQPEPDIIIAIDTHLIEKIISYTMENYPEIIFRDEHGEIITADNFTTLARADHDLRAPRRQPKTKFLNFFGKQLWEYFAMSSILDRYKIVKLIYESKNERHWQAYSKIKLLQNLFVAIQADGQTTQSKKENIIYFVPSNVGVNKCNHLTQFYVTTGESVSTLSASQYLPLQSEDNFVELITINSELIDINSPTSQMSYMIKIVNNNEMPTSSLLADRLQFADYQRLLLPPSVHLEEVIFNNEIITDFDKREIVDDDGEHWQEIGFLIIIDEQQTGILYIRMTGPVRSWRLRG